MNGVIEYNGDDWIYHFEQPGLPDDEIYAIEAASDGYVYAATCGSGVARYDGRKWEIFLDDNHDDYPYNYWSMDVRDIVETPDGILWFASFSGVFCTNTKDFAQCSAVNGEPIMESASIAADGERVLVATPEGIYGYGENTAGFKTAVIDNPIVTVGKNRQPAEISLTIGNHPNPFNAGTEISYYLAHDGRETIAVYSITGQRVAILADVMTRAGRHTLFWNGTDDSGATLSSGMYFARICQDGHSATSRMLLLK